MPTLTVRFEDRVLNEYGVGLILTIGRLPDNTIVIDNPAVSGHHACVYREGGRFVVEDLDSTNGTFVNEQRVAVRHGLHDGDVLLIGKHRLAFDQTRSVEPRSEDTQRMLATLRDTLFLDTEKHKELLLKLKEAEIEAARLTGSTPGVGVLRVLDGPAEQHEYRLDARTSVIGKSENALVRLHGWFKPKVAVAIARNGAAYVATVLGGRTLINNRRISGRLELKDGDVLEISDLRLRFQLKA